MKTSSGMKCISIRKVHVGILSAVLLAGSAWSQAQTQDHVARVNVPFVFDCGSEHFEAGAYMINIEGNKLVALRNAAGTSSVLATIGSRWTSDSGSPSATASLTFRKYGNTYFLGEYSNRGATFSLIESNNERSLSRKYALTQMKSSLIEVAALGK
jgi:hypothetical protein